MLISPGDEPMTDGWETGSLDSSSSQVEQTINPQIHILHLYRLQRLKRMPSQMGVLTSVI